MNGGGPSGQVPRSGNGLAGALRAWWAARFRGGAPEPRIRFRDAVPVRRDRRDLRRRFRRAARGALNERKSEMTAVLRRLSANQVRLSDVTPEAEGKGKVVVFSDGTRLLLGIRSGGDGVDRLGLAESRFTVRLAEVQPCFGRRLFWLEFTCADRAVPLAVLASVAPVPPGRSA